MEGEEAYSNVLSASEAWNLLVDYIGECLDMDTLQVYRCTCVAGVLLNSAIRDGRVCCLLLCKTRSMM